ncbi:nucleolar protein 10 [Juglans regia]|uniref:Nucleolar protein 10 n=2 Tax=Juglans regia TaxID=51240 RepID=A0A2I4GX07_JUGRE|nr:nucleolar protein 10 [Juglans regia]
MAYQGGSLKSTSINGVKTYTVASQNRSLASWLDPKKQRALRKDKNYMQRVDLIQDLRFETATTKIKATPDGQYLIASGIYPPQVKVYELRQLALKFERHLDSEIIDFQVLADDYSKLAFLCADRSVCLHAKYGKHHCLRIPRMGRGMAYDCWSCDLLCASSSPDLYRINLEQGRFLSSLTTQSPAINVVSRSKLHGLIACGGEDGALECFDIRMRSSVGRIDAVAPTGDIDQEVTSLEFDGDGGFQLAVGSSTGKVLIYDLRSSYPIRVKDHMYGSPILDIKWHRTLNSEQPKLITTDNHVVRIWDPETGEGMTSIEPTAGAINDICVFDGSGLMLLALDCSQMPSYFVPALGPAPKWCSYLENLTEELEEGAQTTIYDNFKFLTKEDLEKLKLTNLIGTNLVRAYMHGFFIDYRLYKKAKALADPFAYDAYVEQRKREKFENERASRITIRRKLPKVNRDLAARILEGEEAENEKKDADDNDTKKPSKKKKGLGSEVLEDERFAAMFRNKEFEIDESSYDYLSLHPVSSNKQPSLVEEHFERVMEDEDHSLSDSDVSAASQSSDGELGSDKSKAKKKAQVPRLYEVKDERHAEAFWSDVSLAREDLLPIGERVAALKDDRRPSGIPSDVKFGPGGSREISFTSRSSARYKEDDEDKERQLGKKRGVQSLGLKPDTSRFGGRGRGRGRGRNRGRGRRGRW